MSAGGRVIPIMIIIRNPAPMHDQKNQKHAADEVEKVEISDLSAGSVSGQVFIAAAPCLTDHMNRAPGVPNDPARSGPKEKVLYSWSMRGHDDAVDIAVAGVVNDDASRMPRCQNGFCTRQ